MDWQVIKLWSEFANLRSVVTVSDTQAWAVGQTSTGDVIARYKKNDWISEALPADYDQVHSELMYVDAGVEKNGWIVGQAIDPSRHDLGYETSIGLVLYNGGTHWVQSHVIADPINDGLGFYCVCALNDHCIWAGGQQTTSIWGDIHDVIYFWDGDAWTKQFYGTVGMYGSSNITQISALSPTSAWATSGSGHIYHWDGATWSVQYLNPHTGSNALFTICATDATHVWAGGYSVGSSEILYYDGNSWVLTPMVMELWIPAGHGYPEGWYPLPYSAIGDISAISNNDLWAVGINFLLRFNRWESGTAYWRVEYVSFDMWSGIPPTIIDNMMAISVLSEKRGWAVGYESDSGAGTNLGVFIGQEALKEISGMLKEGVLISMLG